MPIVVTLGGVVKVEVVALPWLMQLVNGYGSQPRMVAGEDRDPYPTLANGPGDGDVTTVSRSVLISLADRLWSVFAASDHAERAARLNDLIEEAGLSPRIDEHGAPSWVTSRGDRLVAACAAAVLEAVREHGWARLGICAGDACVDVYLATSARGQRRYCSSACLNRARVRAYRSRQRAGNQQRVGR